MKTELSTISRPTLNPVLRSFWLTKARNRILYGGRVSSKSWDAAGFATFLSNKYRLRILCVRQFQNRIAESVYSLLKVQIERFGLGSRFDIQRDKIINEVTGSEFLFYGLWRSIDEIKSMEGIDILWIEEAHNLTEEQWDILEATVRKEHSQIWIVFNPRLGTDFVYKKFVLGSLPNTIRRKINYDENPFLSDTMREIIDALKVSDPEKYGHIYCGEPLDNDDSSIIKRSWIIASIDAHKRLGFEPTGSKRIGFDIADSGEDECSYSYAHGCVVLDADSWKAKEDEILKSCTRVFSEARNRTASITYDSIGVGASAGAKFGELNESLVNVHRVRYSKFNAGGAVFRPEAMYSQGTKNKDMFLNIKAQAWWLLADRFRNTYNAVRNGEKFNHDELISLSSTLPGLELLIEELSTPQKNYVNGKVKVESKEDLAKRGIPSPNKADGLVMVFVPGAQPMIINPLVLAAA